jgi:hypothetical protein
MMRVLVPFSMRAAASTISSTCAFECLCVLVCVRVPMFVHVCARVSMCGAGVVFETPLQKSRGVPREPV